jgi:hypothetical protein
VPLRIDSHLVFNEERNQRGFESKREQHPTAKADEAPVGLSVAKAPRHVGTVASRERADRLWPKHSENPSNQSAD